MIKRYENLAKMLGELSIEKSVVLMSREGIIEDLEYGELRDTVVGKMWKDGFKLGIGKNLLEKMVEEIVWGIEDRRVMQARDAYSKVWGSVEERFQDFEGRNGDEEVYRIF